jgi:hypothetical protein
MNWSILVMLASPYLLFASICGLMVRAIRRARRERERADEFRAATVTSPEPPDPDPDQSSSG